MEEEEVEVEGSFAENFTPIVFHILTSTEMYHLHVHVTTKNVLLSYTSRTWQIQKNILHAIVTAVLFTLIFALSFLPVPGVTARVLQPCLILTGRLSYYSFGLKTNFASLSHSKIPTFAPFCICYEGKKSLSVYPTTWRPLTSSPPPPSFSDTGSRM